MTKKKKHLEIERHQSSRGEKSYFRQYEKQRQAYQKNRYQEISQLPLQEFSLQYATLQSKYEFRKTWLTTIIGTVMLTTILAIFAIIYQLIIKVFPRLLEVSKEQAQVIIVSVVVMVGTLLIILIFILYLANLFFKGMRKLKNELVLYQEVKDNRKVKK